MRFWRMHQLWELAEVGRVTPDEAELELTQIYREEKELAQTALTELRRKT